MSARARPDELERGARRARRRRRVRGPSGHRGHRHLCCRSPTATGRRPTSSPSGSGCVSTRSSFQVRSGRVAIIASHAAPVVDRQLMTFRRAGDEGVQPYWMPADDEGLRCRPVHGGRQVPRAPSDDRPPAADVAAVELRHLPPPVDRRRVRVRVRRPRQRVRSAADRGRRGPRPHGGSRRVRRGRSTSPTSSTC